MERALYAAYGSNLNHMQMSYRCPKAVFAGTGILKDHALVFRRVADIEPAKGKNVPIGLWWITQECLEALDAYEGFPTLYGRKQLTITLPSKKERQALIYFMRYGDYESPTRRYFESIEEGYEHCGLAKEPLLQALENTRASVEDYDRQLVNI